MYAHEKEAAGLHLSVHSMTVFPYVWQVGEDVADARKCACASHVPKVAEFFQVSDEV